MRTTLSQVHLGRELITRFKTKIWDSQKPLSLKEDRQVDNLYTVRDGLTKRETSLVSKRGRTRLPIITILKSLLETDQDHNFILLNLETIWRRIETKARLWGQHSLTIWPKQILYQKRLNLPLANTLGFTIFLSETQHGQKTLILVRSERFKIWQYRQ